jgi:hypothetical protein
MPGTSLALSVLLLAAAPVAPTAPVYRQPLGDGNHSVGAPFVKENLAVYPIYAEHQEDPGEYATLEAALAAGTAVVRELGADAPAAPARSMRSMNQQAYAGGGAEVNRLALENKGKLPILVLAGTVVKGGRQDRQIGQDFVVAPGATVPVDAFCVEHGRWVEQREGHDTGGKFETAGVLAQAQVRSAAQYEANQGKVWEKVGSVNAQAGKAPASGTLMATLGDKELSARREGLAAGAATYLGALGDGATVVGIAYAVNGKVVGARWFLSHRLFEQYRPTLLATAAQDAVGAPVPAAVQGAPAPAGVKGFLDDAQKAAVSRKAKTAAGNENAYKDSAAAFSSDTYVPVNGAPKAVTSDVTAK